jgi:dienelactone hydrolase
MNSPWRRMVMTLVVAVALLGFGGFRLATLHSDVAQTSATLRDGLPVTTYALPNVQTASAQAVVVLHGYTASGVIVRSLSTALARAGFVVAVPDFAGHGRNVSAAAPLDERVDQWRDQTLQVIEHLAADPRVDPEAGVGVVGHSLGALAAFEVTGGDPALPIRTIVAVSPPSLDGLNATVPTVFLYGSLEMQSFIDASIDGEQSLRSAGARTDVIRIDGVEHVGIILSPETAHAAIRWLQGGAGSQPTSIPVTPPLLPLMLVIAGLVLIAGPAVRLALGPRITPARGPDFGKALIFITAALAAGASAAWLSAATHAAFPIEVGGYLVALFGVAGMVLWLLLKWWRRGLSHGDGQGSDPSVLRTTVGTLALTAFFIAVLALSAQASWSAFHLAGPRRWALPVMEMALIIFFIAESMLVRRQSARQQVVLMVAVRVLIVLTMAAGVHLLDAPRILVIQIPLIAILLALTGWWGHVVSRHTVEPWAVATVQAIPIAYAAATALPLQ